MRKIAKYLQKKEWLFMGLSLLLILCQVFFELQIPDYMSDITALIQTPSSSINAVIAAGGSMLFCALITMVLSMITAYLVARIGAALSMRLRAALFDQTLRFSMEELNHFSIASLITRCTNDVTQVQMLVTMGLQIIFKAPILAVWAIMKIAGKNFQWTMATIAAVAGLVVLLVVVIAIAYPKLTRVQQLTDDLNRVTREHLTGLRVIRAFETQSFHQDRFENINTQMTNTNLFVSRTMALLTPGISMMMAGASLAIYVLGAIMISAAAGAEKLTLFSEMVVFSSYSMQVVSAFMLMALIFLIMPRAMVSIRRMNEVLDMDISLKDGNRTTGVEGMEGTVEFKEVSFRYPDAEESVLYDISFTAKKGETVAFIGSTGCGKSTVIQLIPRFYDATHGQILVDGVDVKEYTQEALRNRISYVPQKSTLFSGTVSSNIAYGENGQADARQSDIEHAAIVGRADEFIRNKEDGYQSHVSQGGSNFSGGQKQRLSIARAVCRDPEIYLFDDSFSALDYKTDRDVRAALREAAGDATMLIVGQRIGTIRNADQIIVLEEGRIVGKGKHEDLMENCPVYREIALSQLSEKEAH